MTICYLGLGSNLKHPEKYIRLAIRHLRKSKKMQVLKVADLSMTTPWGIRSQPRYCNTAIAIKTQLTPLHLLRYCQTVEKRFGRLRKKPWGPRTLDIDILLYGKQTIQSPRLTIPHPRMMEREFVLTPLRSIGGLPFSKI